MYTLKHTTVHPRAIGPRSLTRFCNKLTTLYYSPSAQECGRVSCDTIVFACILKEWNRCHNERPHIDFGHFLANPIRLTSTGPTTIPAILSAHQVSNEQTAFFLDRIRSGAAGDASDFFMAEWPNLPTTSFFAFAERSYSFSINSLITTGMIAMITCTSMKP